MKVQTVDLKDLALDWAVAKAADMLGKRVDVRAGTSAVLCEFDQGKLWVWDSSTSDYALFEPSTNGSQAVPIIDREGIDLRKRVPDPDIARPDPRFAWKAEIVATNPYYCGTGPTLLIAAMRCFVASKLGREVEIPDEVLAAQRHASRTSRSTETGDAASSIREQQRGG